MPWNDVRKSCWHAWPKITWYWWLHVVTSYHCTFPMGIELSGYYMTVYVYCFFFIVTFRKRAIGSVGCLLTTHCRLPSTFCLYFVLNVILDGQSGVVVKYHHCYTISDAVTRTKILLVGVWWHRDISHLVNSETMVIRLMQSLQISADSFVTVSPTDKLVFIVCENNNY